MSLRKRKQLLIIRGSSQYLDIDKYNVQEIGLGKILVDRNWDVTVYTSGEKAETRIINEYLRWIQVRRYLGKYGWPSEIRKFLKGADPDIIQCQDLSNFATIMPFIIKNIKAPIVLSLGEYYPKSKLTSIFNKVASMIIKKRTKLVLCKTKQSLDYAKQLGFNNIQYAPVGIDDEQFIEDINDNKLEQKLELIKQNISDGKRILCHIGRLDKADNHVFLSNVIEQLSDNYRLILVGGPVPNIQHKCIYYFGKLPNNNIGPILKYSDLYLSCSSYEPFGLSAVESIYNGCPVIGFATGGLHETVKNNVNGILVNNRDSKKWAELIDNLFETNEIQGLKNGCLATKETLTWSTRANIYQESYEKTLNTKKNSTDHNSQTKAHLL